MLEIRGGSGWGGRSLQLLKELCHKARDVNKSLQPDTGHLLGNGLHLFAVFKSIRMPWCLRLENPGVTWTSWHPGTRALLKTSNMATVPEPISIR